MKIKTDSGNIEVVKRSKYARFVDGYISTGAFSGNSTLTAAHARGVELMENYPSLSAYDAGRITGELFKRHDNAITDALCGSTGCRKCHRPTKFAELELAGGICNSCYNQYC